MNVKFLPWLVKCSTMIIMKKIVLILTLLLFANSVFAENTNEKRNAFKDMARSHQYQHETCIRISRNFRSDNRFSNYIRNNCLLYESDRQRMLDTIFPISNNVDDSYKDGYPILKANFAIAMNKREIENYRLIVQEYCKYNKYKFDKKDPEACSAKRINSLF